MRPSDEVIVITDDVKGAAALAFVYAKRGMYLRVLEGPRLKRPDASNEIIRILNVISRYPSRKIIIYKLPSEVSKEIKSSGFKNVIDAKTLTDLAQFGVNPTVWKNLTAEAAVNKFLLKHEKAVHEEKIILYDGSVEIGYAIASIYAVFHGAKIIRIESGTAFYRASVDKLNEIDDNDHPEIRRILIEELQDAIAPLIPEEINQTSARIMIITEGVPYNICLQEKEIIYANILMLGYLLAHNVYERFWGDYVRIGPIGLFVEDRTLGTDDEYKYLERALSRLRGIVKRLSIGHPKISELDIITLPYDVLYIATHGKQLKAKENKYRIKLSDGNIHEVVMRVADGKLGVVFFLVSIDSLTRDMAEWSQQHSEFWAELIKKYAVERTKLPEPIESADTVVPMRTLVLGDGPGATSPLGLQRLASAQRPIVIANACGSWNDLSGRFMYAGGSIYIGTLWRVKSSIASQFAKQLFSNMFGRDIFDAFEIAKRNLNNPIDRMNYVFTGSFENKYDGDGAVRANGLRELIRRLKVNLAQTKHKIASFDENTPDDIKNNTEIDEYYYEKELDELQNVD